MILSTDLPEKLAQEETRKWSEFCQSVDAAGIDLLDDDTFVHSAKRAFLFSDFIFKNCTRRPEILANLVQSGDLQITDDALFAIATEKLYDNQYI